MIAIRFVVGAQMCFLEKVLTRKISLKRALIGSKIRIEKKFVAILMNFEDYLSGIE